jgi:predicted nucleic acid-binding protein
MKLLDTSVAIDHLRGVQSAIELLSHIVSNDEPLVASEIVRFELLAGVRDGELDSVELFCSAIAWVPVDESVVRTAGSLAREHRRAHSGIDDADYLIAATSLILDADLLTMNVRHFPMLGGLRPAY